jgi:polyhydroxyalkanoate synthesis regulator phasin
MGLVDDVEVLKKSEIFDKEGVLQRKGQMAQMQGYIQQLEKQIKDLSGDLQTAQRENVNSRKQVEAQKFKSQLKDVLTNAKFDSKVKLDRLKNVVDAQEGIAKQEAKEK